MSTRTETYKICNGCGKSERDEIEIADSRAFNREFDPNTTVDICYGCQELDRYICRLCRSVHGDDKPCDGVIALRMRAAEIAKEGER